MQFLSARVWKQVLYVVGLSLGLLVVSLPSFSQGNAGRIAGAVTDQTGGAIAGATVTLTDVQRGVSRTLTTDDSGAYNAPNLTPGTYKVRAEFKGFKAVERDNVLLETGGEDRVDLTLQPGEQTQTITVTEALPLVETTNAELGGTLQSDIVNNLPLNGRNFSNLLQLRPGVTIYPGGSGWTQSTNGMRAHDNVYMVDGINGDDPWMSQAVWDAVMASGDSGTLISVDAIDEFKTEENPRAEYGWKPGAVVNVGIKSGTNAIHGTGYAYGRDGAWDARDFFNPAPLPTAPVELEQFGATLGGPVVKDKLFYFLTFEDQRYAVGSLQDIQTPITTAGVGPNSINMIAACKAALAVGPIGSTKPGSLTALSAQLAGLSPTCVPLANYPGLFPINNGSNSTGNGVQFIPNGLNNTNRIDSGLGKANYHISDKNSITGLYYISPGSGILNDSPTQSNPIWETNQYARSMAFAGNWTFTPNSQWVNEARVGYSHYYQVFEPQDATLNPASYPFNGSTYNYYTGQTNPLYSGFPGLSISGLTGALGASWPKIVGPDGVLQITDHISYLRGKHSFKFGGEILENQSTSDVTANAKGPIKFDSLQDFFNGYPDGFPGDTANSGSGTTTKGSATILTGNLLRHFTYAGYALFLQDDWRIKPRLTLNLGLRYEINTVPVERNNLQGNFDPNSPTGEVQVGVGSTSVYGGDHNNFGPRVGLAYDVFGTGRTVVRAGGGILYEQLSLDVFNGIGNSFGLRTAPTGATLVYSTPVAGGGSASVVQPGNGTIGVINTAFANTPIIRGYTGTPAAGAVPPANPGSIPFQWANNSPTNTIFQFQAFCGDGKTAVPTGLLAGFTPQQCNVMGVDPNLRTPYVSDFSLDLQQAITHSVSLDIGYVGNHGTKLISALDINQPSCAAATSPANIALGALPCAPGVVAPGWTSAAITSCLASAANCNPSTANETVSRPFAAKFPYFRYIDEFGNNDTSNYNSLQVVLTMRNYHGLSLTGGYTFSKALADASDQGTGGGNYIPINSYGSLRSQLYTATNFDIRDRGTISGTYNIPGRNGFGQILSGWSLNAVAILQSGLPWGVSDASTDFAGNSEFTSNSATNEGGQWNFYGNPSAWEAIHNFANVTPGPNGAPGIPWFPGTSNPTCLAQAQLNGPAGRRLAHEPGLLRV